MRRPVVLDKGSLRCRILLALVAAGPLLRAAPPDWSGFGGVQVQVSGALPVGQPSLAEDLRGHLGLGVGLYLGVRASERNAFRLTLDFTGTESATWYYFYPNRADSIEYKDIWRVLRLGLEHEITLDKGEKFFASWGGGVEETWVNRTEGSLLQVTLLAVAWTQGATSGAARYSTKTTTLDQVNPFLSAGLGWRRGPNNSVELRYLVGPYLRYKDTGLRTTADGPTETAMGHRLVLSWALRFGD